MDISMAQTPDTNAEYEVLEARLKTLLPEEYQDSYEDVQPVSMGSAGLEGRKHSSIQTTSNQIGKSCRAHWRP